MSLPQEAKKQVEEFLVKGERVGAIKLLKDNYGFSLKEAKVILEALESRVSLTSDRASQTTTPCLDWALRNEVIDFLIDRDKIRAIKHVKDSLNISLKQAKDLVEEVATELFPPSNWPKRQQAQRTSGKLSPLIFMGIGVLLLAVSAYLYLTRQKSIAASDLITGKVVRMNINNDGLAAPIIEYQWAGQSWLYASTTYSKPAAFEINEEVPIYVNREKPTDITVNTFGERWLGIAICGILGFFSVGIPLLFPWISMRR